jgi:hypothetical protein
VRKWRIKEACTGLSSRAVVPVGEEERSSWTAEEDEQAGQVWSMPTTGRP